MAASARGNNMSLMGSKKINATHGCLVAIGVVLVLLGSAQQTDALLIINRASVPVNVSVSVNGSSSGSVVAGASLNVSLPGLLNVTSTTSLNVNLTFTNLGPRGATVTVLNVSITSTSALVITSSPVLLPTAPPPPPPAASPPPPLPGVPVVPVLNAVNVFLVTVVNGVITLVRTLVISL